MTVPVALAITTIMGGVVSEDGGALLLATKTGAGEAVVSFPSDRLPALVALAAAARQNASGGTA